MSADGELVAAGSADAVVAVWRTGTGELVARLDGFGGRVECVDLSPDGSQLVAASLGGRPGCTASRRWRSPSRSRSPTG